MLEKILCIKDGGLEIFSKEYFNSPFKIDQQLLAGFFYAIQSISEELKNPVSYIRLQNSFVYIKSYGEFFLILMFTSIPNEILVSKSFEELAMLVINNFDILDKLEYPKDFTDKIDKILSPIIENQFIETDYSKVILPRIALLGLAKAGKSSIKERFFNNYSFEQLENITPTIGIETSKNVVQYMQESIIVMDYGGQKLYRLRYLEEDKNWINISSVIYVIDIQDKNSFLDSLDFLKKVWAKIKTVNERRPSLFLYFHKYDSKLKKSLETNLQEVTILFKDFIEISTLFFTSITDNSSIKAIINSLFFSLPNLVIKQILQSFLIEMFQESILIKIKELRSGSKDSNKLFKAGERIGDEMITIFQSKWLDYYLGSYKVPEQLLNTKKVYLSQNGNSLKLEIDNWENQGISSEITNPFLTGFLTSLFRSLYIKPHVEPEINKFSTIWKIDVN